jgi:hypothetical protein
MSFNNNAQVIDKLQISPNEWWNQSEMIVKDIAKLEKKI